MDELGKVMARAGELRRLDGATLTIASERLRGPRTLPRPERRRLEVQSVERIAAHRYFEQWQGAKAALETLERDRGELVSRVEGWRIGYLALCRRVHRLRWIAAGGWVAAALAAAALVARLVMGG